MAAELGVDAVVLVGGQGTRLRPLTLSAPKPMLPTAGTPFLSHLLSRIRDAGITHVVLGTSYRAEVFEDYFGDGSAFGLELEYVVEKEPLDTAGAIRSFALSTHFCSLGRFSFSRYCRYAAIAPRAWPDWRNDSARP